MFPATRLRRLRRSPALRGMVRQTGLDAGDFIQPVFVVPGEGVKREIPSMPGNYHLSLDRVTDEMKEIRDLGVPAVLLFGIPEKRDELACESYSPRGVVQRAVERIKEEVPGIAVITDVCLCEYTPHGHCGIMEDGYLANDKSVELLRKVAVSHARAGSDMVAPAAMLDGQVSAIRAALDEGGFTETAIMGYSAKFASRLYDPFFKHGTQSSVAFGDKKSHQMDYGNSDEAMREIAFDIQEGADIVMVKPGMFYMDIIYRARREFGVPVAVYNVSGEYALVKSAAEMGRLDENAVTLELFTAFKRAGADLIISYAAKSMARWLKGNTP
jgi:porphobilinogen synthase